MEPNRPEPKANQKRPWWELPLTISWMFGTMFLSVYVLAPKLFLVYRYGWIRVLQEHLHFLAMPRDGRWPVSNGDLITDGQSEHLVILALCWFGLVYSPLILYIVYCLLRMSFRKQRREAERRKSQVGRTVKGRRRPHLR